MQTNHAIYLPIFQNDIRCNIRMIFCEISCSDKYQTNFPFPIRSGFFFLSTNILRYYLSETW